MLIGLFTRLFGGKGKGAERERTAPARDEAPPPPSAQAGPPLAAGFLCREVVLDREQRVAGYHLMLHEGARQRSRVADRPTRHAYAEVLVRGVAGLASHSTRGERRIFLDLPDSFLCHGVLADLPADRTVLAVDATGDADAPPPEALLQAVRTLRQQGFRIAIPDPEVITELSGLLPEADYVMVHATAGGAARVRQTAERLRRTAPHAALLARGVPSEEDFCFCRDLGAALFQGPFVTRREDWHGRQLGAGTTRLADLLNRLRRGAETHELAEVLKQDAALTLRLMRYINSAAVGLHEHVSSIERAMMLLGRDKLYRWLTVLLYSADRGSPRASAALENALVRARLMELLGEARPAAEREALFLTGLLSLIDVVLEVPVEQAMEALRTAPEIEDAVVSGRGPLADLLQLAIACESMDSERVEAAAERCAISPTTASRCHLEALTWALELDV